MKKLNLKNALTFTLCLLPAAIIGGWFVAKYTIAGMDETILEKAIQQVGSMDIIMLATVVQSVIYAAVCGFFGYIIAGKLGLIRPLRFEKKGMMFALLFGILAGVTLSADAFTFAKWIPELDGYYDSSAAFDAPTWIGSILYGGVIEEVMMRLFLMSLLALIGWKLFCKKEEKAPVKVLVISNVIAAMVFAALHLPATVLLFGTLTPMLVFRCFLMNGFYGILFGNLYRKHGIQYAMLAHMLAHIVSRTIWLILL